jgi:hypothetical protein
VWLVRMGVKVKLRPQPEAQLEENERKSARAEIYILKYLAGLGHDPNKGCNGK